MAGFMAGLGGAFSRSFESGLERANANKQDAFRVAYDDWTKKREKYSEDEASWKKYTEAGNLMAERYGAPKEAGLKAAEWLMAGYSMKDVDEMMRTTKFVAAPQPDQVDDPAQAPNPDQQTQEAFNQADKNIADPTTQPNPEIQQQEQGGLLEGLSGIFPNAGLSDAEKAQKKLMETTGVTQEEFDRVQGGFQRPDAPQIQMSMSTESFSPLEEFGLADGITDAKLKAAIVTAKQYENSDDPVLRGKAQRFNAILPDIVAAELMTKDPTTNDSKALDMLKVSQTPRIELSTTRARTATMAQEGKQLVDMVSASGGNVLTQTSGVVSGFEYIKKEANSVLDLVSGMVTQAGGDPDQSTLLNGLDNFINGQLEAGTYTEEQARQTREFHAAAIRYAYSVGKAMGQTGNGFSNKDFENIYKTIVTSNDSVAFDNNLKALINNQIRDVDTQTTSMLGEAGIKYTIENYPEIGKYLQDDLRTVESLISDPSVMEWLNSPNKTHGTGTPTTPNKEGTQEASPEAAPDKQKGATRRDKAGNIWVFNGGVWEDPSNWTQQGTE